MLNIQNNGPDIVFSNFWDLEPAKKGYFFLSVNAGCARLLIPDGRIAEIEEMKTGKIVIISRGPWSQAGKKEAVELLFEDYSETPYSMNLGAKQIDRLIPSSDNGRDLLFAAYTRGSIKAMERPAKFRTVKKLPCLKPWK